MEVVQTLKQAVNQLHLKFIIYENIQYKKIYMNHYNEIVIVIPRTNYIKCAICRLLFQQVYYEM